MLLFGAKLKNQGELEKSNIRLAFMLSDIDGLVKAQNISVDA
jgi:hypothetical protein